jgi:hypothetical protein
MELKRKKDRKKTLKGKVTFRCFEDEESEVKRLSAEFDFNEWFRDSLKEALKRARKSAS